MPTFVEMDEQTTLSAQIDAEHLRGITPGSPPNGI